MDRDLRVRILVEIVDTELDEVLQAVERPMETSDSVLVTLVPDILCEIHSASCGIGVVNRELLDQRQRVVGLACIMAGCAAL